MQGLGSFAEMRFPRWNRMNRILCHNRTFTSRDCVRAHSNRSAGAWRRMPGAPTKRSFCNFYMARLALHLEVLDLVGLAVVLELPLTFSSIKAQRCMGC